MLRLDFAPELADFRAQVRDFLHDALPADIRRRTANCEHIEKSEQQRWDRILAAKGWRAPNWPKDHGGPGWSAMERFVYDEEYSLASAPRGNPAGVSLLGPILISYGTEEQKRRFLPPILSSEEWWCQGFSEADAGSDLAALRATACRDGDDYIVNGVKLWTSYAHDAEWMFLLARTSKEERKQAGISFFLMPMDSPGITVTPIVTLGGLHMVNQVMLDDVRIPSAYRVGEDGAGWRIAGSLLGHERFVGARLAPTTALLQHIRKLVNVYAGCDKPLAADPHFAAELARLEIDLLALKATAYRVMSQETPGTSPGPEVSVLKLQGAKLMQDVADLLASIAGPLAIADPGSATGTVPFDHQLAYLSQQALDLRKLTIFGGSSEIQKNIIARRILQV